MERGPIALRTRDLIFAYRKIDRAGRIETDLDQYNSKHMRRWKRIIRLRREARAVIGVI